MPKRIKKILKAATHGPSTRKKHKLKQQKSKRRTTTTIKSKPRPQQPKNAIVTELTKLHQTRRTHRHNLSPSSTTSVAAKNLQRTLQRNRDLRQARNPRSLEHLKAKKSGDPRQLKGFKSKLTILTIPYYKQADANQELAPFRDSYFAAKVNATLAHNRSMEMRQLKDRIGPLCPSLPHVLLHKAAIFSAILEFINNEAHKYILRDAVGLLLELAKDIRGEFIPFVDDLMLFMVEMLEWKEGNLMNVQIVFKAFSALFRYLQTYLSVDDIKKYYKTYFVRFLARKSYYIRDFMAEVFASIFRSKVMLHFQAGTDKDKDTASFTCTDNDKILLLRNDILSINLRDFLWETAQMSDSKRTRKHLQIGLSVFLFQIVRGILKGFHSKTTRMLPVILRVLRRPRISGGDDDDDDEAEHGLRLREQEDIEHQMLIFTEFVDLSAVYTNRAHCLQFFAPFYATVNSHLRFMQKTYAAPRVSDVSVPGIFREQSSEQNSQDEAIGDILGMISEQPEQQEEEEDEEEDVENILGTGTESMSASPSSVLLETHTFLSDLDYLNRLLRLLHVWLSHNVGEVVPVSAFPNLCSFVTRLTSDAWLQVITDTHDAADVDPARTAVLRHAVNVMIACCKIHGLKKHGKFQKQAQNGLKRVLTRCDAQPDIELVQVVIDKLGATSVLSDRGMNAFLVQWIETWTKRYDGDGGDGKGKDDVGMRTLLALMRTSKPELVRVQHGSDMMARVKQSLLAPLHANANANAKGNDAEHVEESVENSVESDETEDDEDDDEEPIQNTEMKTATKPEQKSEQTKTKTKTQEMEIEQALQAYNATNIGEISHAQSRQIQQYLPMLEHFSNRAQWIESLTNLVRLLTQFVIGRANDGVVHREGYRLQLLQAMQNTLVDLLITHLRRSLLDKTTANKKKKTAIPSVMRAFDRHWQQWFTLVRSHACNPAVLDASLCLMQFVHSFHSILLNKECSENTSEGVVLFSEPFQNFRTSVEHILSQTVFSQFLPCLLPHLCGADQNARRNAMDILCLYNAETRFTHCDDYGSRVQRAPVLPEVKALFDDDWGPSLARDRDNRMVQLISWAKGVQPNMYAAQRESQRDVLQKLTDKHDGVQLGVRDVRRTVAYLEVDKDGSGNVPGTDSGADDYQLQIVCHAVFGLFRVNYRPLWSHCIELLNVLSQRFPTVLWPMYRRLISDFMRITHIRRDLSKKLEARQQLLVCSENKKNKKKPSGTVAASRPLQVLNFMFEHLNANHSFVEPRVADVIDIFLQFMDEQYHLAFPHEAIAGNFGQILDAEHGENDTVKKVFDWSARRSCIDAKSAKIRVTAKLRNFLSLFRDLTVDYQSKLDTAQLHRLRDTFYLVLLLRDVEIQKMTLAAYVRFYPQIAKYYSFEMVKQNKVFAAQRQLQQAATTATNQKPGSQSHDENLKSRHKNCSLKSLLALNTLRAGLSNLNMIRGDVRCVVSARDRKFLVPVVLRILYTKLFEHQKRKIKSSLSSRRTAIVTYISTLQPNEIGAFLQILHHPFSRWTADFENSEKFRTFSKCSPLACGLPFQRQYLSIVQIWQKCTPMSMAPFLAEFRTYLTLVFKHCHQFRVNAQYRTPQRVFSESDENLCLDMFHAAMEVMTVLSQTFGESMLVRAMLLDWMTFTRSFLERNLPETRHKNHYNDIATIWNLWRTVARNLETCPFFGNSSHEDDDGDGGAWPLLLVLRCLQSAHISDFSKSSALAILTSLIGNAEIMRPLFIACDSQLLQCMVHLLQTNAILNVSASSENTLKKSKNPKHVNEKKLRQKRLKWTKSEMQILIYLSSILENATELESLSNALIPYLLQFKKSGTITFNILRVLQNVLPHVRNYAAWIDPLCTILNSVDDPRARQSLCTLLLQISRTAEQNGGNDGAQWLKLVAPTLLDLNCVYVEERTGAIQTLNLRRLRAYDEFCTELLPQLQYEQLKLVTSTILYDIAHSEPRSALQFAGMDALRRVIEFDYVNHAHLREAHLVRLIDTFINEFVVRNIQHEQSRNQFMSLFAVICKARPTLNGNLHVLVDHDSVVQSQDFFTLVSSEKTGDQVTALQIACMFLKPNQTEIPILNNRAIVILLPIVRSFVYCAGDMASDLRATAMKVVAAMADCACWIVYRYMVHKFMSDYQREDKRKHINYKIIALECVMRISKRFHFAVDCMQANLSRLDEALSTRASKQNIWETIDEEKTEEEKNEEQVGNKQRTDSEQEAKDEEEDEDENEDEDKQMVEKIDDGDNEDEDEDEDLLLADDASEDPNDIQTFMFDHVLTPLMQELGGNKAKIIQSEHVHLLSRTARTVVYIAKFLPKADFDEVFLAAVATSCQFLQSKIPRRRDKARTVLIDILKCVGTQFLRYILQEIEARTIWGRWKHVLGYTLCEILEQMDAAHCIEQGSLDHAAVAMTKILLHDIAGAIGAEKILETRKYRGKEADESRAPNAFRILAKYVTFNPHVHLLLVPIVEFSSRAVDQTDWRLQKIEIVLQSVRDGLQSNASVALDDWIAFNHRMVTEQIQILNAGKQNKFGVDAIHALTQPNTLRRGKQSNTPFLLAAPNRASLVSSTSSQKPSAIVVVQFCLDLLLLLFRHKKWRKSLDAYNRKQLALLPTLCLRVFNECPSEKVHTAVLRIAMHLLPFKLDTFRDFGDIVIEYALEAITKTDKNLKDVSFQLLGTMIEHSQLSLDNNLLDVLTNYIRQHLRGNVCPFGAIHLLHCMLQTKQISPQIYDLMHDVHENLNKLKSDRLTTLYSQCLTVFLLTYPMSDKAIKKHFEKLVGGLQHPYIVGRLCALQLLQKIIDRFPVQIIDVYGMVIYMSLVQQLSNEDDKPCKQQIKHTLIVLFNRIENDQFWQFWTMFEQWTKCESFKLSLAALQSGVAFLRQKKHEITKTNFRKLMKILSNHGLSAAKKEHTSSVKVKDYGQNVVWKPCYLSLVLTQEILAHVWKRQSFALAHEAVFRQCFDDMLVLMDFPHRWIRIVCARILGWFLSVCGKQYLIDGAPANAESDKDKDSGNGAPRNWIDPSQEQIYALCFKQCVVMKDLYISQALCKQCVKNALFLTLVLHEKCNAELEASEDTQWIKALKLKQQQLYRDKLMQQTMNRQDLKVQRERAKLERKREIARLRKEKPDWFEDATKDAEDATVNEQSSTPKNDDDDDDGDDGEEEAEQEEADGDAVMEQTSWIAQDLQTQFDDDDGNDDDVAVQLEPNFRVNEIFKFMSLRIQDQDTSLDIQYSILEWFAGVVIKLDGPSLQMYDYYIVTVIVYMLKQRKNPKIGIELRRQYASIEGKEVLPLSVRQRHRMQMYDKCMDLTNDILVSLKQKIGDSQFLHQFEKIHFKAEKRMRKRKFRDDAGEWQRENKKQKTNDDQDGNWINFLWSTSS